MRPYGDIAMGFDYDETLDATTGLGPSSVERGQRSCRHYCGTDCFLYGNDVDDRKPPRQKRYESTSTGAPRSCAHGHRRSETTSDSTTTRETLPPKVQTVYLNYCKRPEFQEMFWTWWAQLLEVARSPGSSSIVPTRLSVAFGYACQVNILLILWTCC